jgi:hypothetical protein
VQIAVNGCHQWFKDLENIWNIIPKKAYRLKPPNITDEYLIFCWLIGYIDGDGTIYVNNFNKSPSVSVTSCSQAAVAFVKEIIDKHFSEAYLRKKTINIDKTSHVNAQRYTVAGFRSLVIIDYLRQFPIQKLDRKWNNPQIIELINEYKPQYPHLFKTLEIPDQWKNFQNTLIPNNSVIS